MQIRMKVKKLFHSLSQQITHTSFHSSSHYNHNLLLAVSLLIVSYSEIDHKPERNMSDDEEPVNTGGEEEEEEDEEVGSEEEEEVQDDDDDNDDDDDGK